MNELFDLKLSKEEIEHFGKSLGADVVPCLYHGAMLAQGIGDEIVPIYANLKYYLLIIKPQISCSTKEMFRILDMGNGIEQKDTSCTIIKALENQDIDLLANQLYNVFEETFPNKDWLQKMKEELLENGAVGSLLTGSGSCIYGIFKTKEALKQAYENLKNKHEIYIAISEISKKEDLF